MDKGSKETRILTKLTILQIKGMSLLPSSLSPFHPVTAELVCFTSFSQLEFFYVIPLRCISHASKIIRTVVELYNDSNEVSALINSPKRKLTSPVVATTPLPSVSMAAWAMSSHESFNETAASRSPAKPTFLPAWRSLGLPLITTRSRLDVDVSSARRKFAKWIATFSAHPSSCFRYWYLFHVINSISLTGLDCACYEWLVNLIFNLFIFMQNWQYT